jgi:hypothetical protein
MSPGPGVRPLDDPNPPNEAVRLNLHSLQTEGEAVSANWLGLAK